jgi:protein-disulfide isomerase
MVTTFLVICAALVTAAIVRREVFPPEDVGMAPVRDLDDWERLASKGHRMGDPGAAVTIIEFSDFQCPFCAQAEQALHEVRQRYPREVAVVYRHFPLKSHPYATQAALASECAASQGRFEPFHDVLFAGQDSIGRVPWEEFARRASVRSVQDFNQCLGAKRFNGLVEEDAAMARSLNLMGTPTIIVNGRILPGTPSAAELKREVKRALGVMASN